MQRRLPNYFNPATCRIEEFQALIDRSLDPGDVPFAVWVEKNIAIYDGPALLSVLADHERRQALLGEWGRVIGELSGVLVIRQAVTYPDTLDAANRVFETIITEERATHSGADHFAKSGANDRIWNSLQKLCLRDPALFARSFANPAVDGVCEAWLGPGYGMTAQVNLVRPGGAAQVAHRDYHLGFMTTEQAAAFPARAHLLSPTLTLQGAIAHCDMPLESGPTKLLPFSQLYPEGYIACQLDEYREAFERRCVQLPLKKGDGLFFSPALFHAAGTNTSENIHRLANLLQIGSPMGRTLEALDRSAMVRALYPLLVGADYGPQELAAIINAAAEGYPFPTNLDNDPPIGGLAPESQAGLMKRALDSGMSVAEFEAALAEQDARKPA